MGRLGAQPGVVVEPAGLNQPTAALIPASGERDASQPNFPQAKPAPDPSSVERIDGVALPDFRYVSPFSTADCLNILEQVFAALAQEEDGQQLYSTRSMLRAVETTNNYLKQRDELHSTLVGYKWQEIGSIAVGKATYELRGADWDALTQPPEITALSFEARDADVKITSLAVLNDTNERVAFEFSDKSPVVLRHSLPRREVFHLWHPTRLRRLEITAALAPGRAGTVPPLGRVVIHGGSTTRREYAKSAIFSLNETEEDLRSADPRSASIHLADAIDDLRELRRESKGR